MTEVMTDRQMEFIANLIADKFESCKTMEEVKEAIKRVREMVSKDKSKQDEQPEGGLATAFLRA